MPPEIRLIEKLSPKAGDTIAIHYEGYLKAEQMVYFRDAAQKCVPDGVKVMILEKGCQLTHIEAPKDKKP